MLQINIDSRGFSKFKPDRPVKEWNRIVQNLMRNVAQRSVSIVREKMPIQTGKLRSTTVVSYGVRVPTEKGSRVERRELSIGEDSLGDDLAEDVLSSTTIDRRIPMYITPTVYYAGYVNDGTKWQRAQRFMQRSMGEIDAMIQEELDVAFDGWVNSWGLTSGGPSSYFSDYYAAGGPKISP